MSACRAPAVRSLLGRQIRNLRATNQQRRWAQVHDVRFLATTQASRNVVEKYREKLDRKAQEEGHGDIGSLKAAYQDKIKEQRRKDHISTPGLEALLADEEAPAQGSAHSQPSTTTSTNSQTPPSQKQAPSASSNSTIKPLFEILDLPKARDLPLKELSAIWRLRHASNPLSLCAVIPPSTYGALEATARRHPTFVLPVPRAEQGAEIHFLQWVFDAGSRTATVLFTQLAEYKARGEWAQPHTSVTHYRGDEGLAGVPMAGSVVEGRGASVEDARWLVMLMQRFYGAEGQAGEGEKRKLLEDFAKGDGGGFSVERLLEECEKLG